ncbi:HET-E, partial [Mycena rosella]
WSPCGIVIDGQSAAFQSVFFSPDGTRIAPGSRDSHVQLWDALSRVHLQTLQGHSAGVTSLAFSRDGTRLLSGSADTCHTVRLWDAASSANLLTFEKHSEWVTSVDFSSDDARVVSGSEDKNIRVWDVTRSAHLKALDGTDGRVLGFSADGTKLACRKIDGNVRVWHLSTGGHLRTLHGDAWGPKFVAFSPNNLYIVAGSGSSAYDYSVVVWGLASSKPIHRLKKHSDIILAVAFPPNGNQMASGSADSTVCLWDISGGMHLRTFKGHVGWVHHLAFSR